MRIYMPLPMGVIKALDHMRKEMKLTRAALIRMLLIDALRERGYRV